MAGQNDDVSDKIKNIALMFFGAVIIVITLALFKSNMYVFVIFLSLYIGIYSVVIIIYLYKKVNANNPEFNIIINVSLYTICMVIAVILFSIYLMMASYQYRYPTRY